MTARARAAQPSGLELVVSRQRRRPRIKGWVFFTCVVVASFLALIYSRVTLDRSAFVIEELQQELAEHETRYWELRLEVARLESPDRVIRAAEGLGLVYPDSRQTIDVAPVPGSGSDIDERWLELKALLSAQP